MPASWDQPYTTSCCVAGIVLLSARVAGHRCPDHGRDVAPTRQKCRTLAQEIQRSLGGEGVTPGRASHVQSAVNGQLCASNVVAVGRTEIDTGPCYFLSPTKTSHGDLLEQLGTDFLRNGADHFR